MILYYGESINHIKDFAKPLVKVLKIHIVLEVVTRNHRIKVTSNPRVLQSLFHCVTKTWFRMTQLLDKTLR
jgi:hypothetical protein